MATRVVALKDDSKDILAGLLKKHQPMSILEIGTGHGASGIFMLQNAPSECRLVTIEKNRENFEGAVATFSCAGVLKQVEPICGDAGDIIEALENGFDLIFLDGAKGQYDRYFLTLKRLLNAGGVLVADNVLFMGLVNSSEPPPKKKRTIVNNLRKFLSRVQNDPDFDSEVLPCGDGLLVAVKK